MKKSFAMPLILCVAALCAIVLAAQGCVSRSSYDELKARYDELAQRNAETQARLAAAEAAQATANQPAAATEPAAAVENAAPVPAVNGSQETRYTVKKGDTLWSIATHFYGSGKKWTLIRDANPGVIGENGTARIGSVIIIPADAAPAPAK